MTRLAALLLLLALPATARDMTYLTARTLDGHFSLGTMECREIRQAPSSWSIFAGTSPQGVLMTGCWSPRDDGGVTLHMTDPERRTIEVRPADVIYKTIILDEPEDTENMQKSSV